MLLEIKEKYNSASGRKPKQPVVKSNHCSALIECEPLYHTAAISAQFTGLKESWDDYFSRFISQINASVLQHKMMTVYIFTNNMT